MTKKNAKFSLSYTLYVLIKPEACMSCTIFSYFVGYLFIFLHNFTAVKPANRKRKPSYSNRYRLI